MPQNVTDMFSYGNYTSHIALNPYAAAVTSAEGNLISAPASASGGVLTCGDPVTGPAPRFLPAGSFLPGGLNLIYGTDGAGAFVSYSQSGVGSAVAMANAPTLLSPTLTGVVSLTGTLLMPALAANSLLVTPSTPGAITAVGPGTGGILFSSGATPSFSQSVGLTGAVTAFGLHSSGVGEPVSRNDNAAAISAPGGGVSVAQTLWANNVRADTAVSAPTVNATTVLNTPDLTLASFAGATNSIPYTLVTGNFQPMAIGPANTLLVSTGTNSVPVMSSTLAGLTLTAPTIVGASLSGTLSGSASWSSGALSAASPALSGTVTGGATYNGVTLEAPVVTSLIADAAPFRILGRRTSDNRVTETTVVPVARGGTGVATSTGTGDNVLNTAPSLLQPALAYPWKVTGLPAPQTTGFPVNGFLAATNPDGQVEYWSSTGSERVVLANSPTISGPSITGTVGGGATYTAPILTTPTLGVAGATALTIPLASSLVLADRGPNELMVTGAGGAVTTLPIGAANRLLHSHAPGVDPSFLDLDLSGVATALVNLLPVARGGTGSATFPIISLTTGVNDTLPVGNGGTGVTTSTGTGSTVRSATPTLTGPILSAISIPSLGARQLLIMSAGQVVDTVPIGNAGLVLTAHGSGVAPDFQTPSVSSVTGTLAIANGGTGSATASANLVFAGPPSGGAAAPSYRPLVYTDLPTVQFPIRLGFGDTGGSIQTYTMPAACRYIIVELVGAGGQGGNANAGIGGGGGGAGAYATFLLTNVGATYAYLSGRTFATSFGILSGPFTPFTVSAGCGTRGGIGITGVGGDPGFGGLASVTIAPLPPGSSNVAFFSGAQGSSGYVLVPIVPLFFLGLGGQGGPGIRGGGSGNNIALSANGSYGADYTGSGGAGGNVPTGIGGLGALGDVVVTEYYI